MIKIKTALISVYDKSGILELAQKLSDKDIEIISSGGTSKYLKENKIKVTEVEDYTGFSEIFEGRVKTLHPKIHAGILARGEKDSAELKKIGAKKIDLVVVNLYPFKEEVQKGSSNDEIIEKIDIGGPAMLRAAAKNYKYTVAVGDPTDYSEISLDGMSESQSRKLASNIFNKTNLYDSDVASWLKDTKEINLRYGENPHQSAKIKVETTSPIDFLNPLQGKQISYNNVADAMAAWNCVNEFEKPSVCIVKHTNPCGVASDHNLENAYKKAFSTDPTSAFGGVIALNQKADSKVISSIMANQFVEVLIAPDFDQEAINLLKKKENIRVLKGDKFKHLTESYKYNSGVYLELTDDNLNFEKIKLESNTKVKPDSNDINDLLFAMKVAKHVKSNAIVIAKDEMTLGIGAGQMSRVISTKIAFMKAKEEKLDVKDCVLASDAFFPFRDNIDIAANEGVKHIIQPGGSVKDDEVIAAADEHGISMTMTGYRHFKH